MKKIFNRMYETIIFEIGTSLLISVAGSTLSVGNYRVFMIFLCTIALVANLVWSFLCLRKYRYKIRGKDVYYKTNFVVFGILALASIFIYYVDVGGIYTYLFLPFKLFYYLGTKSELVSIIITNLIFFLCVYLVPFTVHKGKRPSSHSKAAENKQ